MTTSTIILAGTGVAIGDVVRWVRAGVTALDVDGPLGPDVEVICAVIVTGALPTSDLLAQ
jgi:hypothetical protein